MRVVFGEIVGDAGLRRVHGRTTEFLGSDILAGRGLHERRAAEKDRPRPFDDDRLIGHRRDVGAAGGARSHDDGNLRDSLRRHPCLVVKDSPEMLAIGENVGL